MLSTKPSSANSSDARRMASNTTLADLSQPKHEQLSMDIPAVSLRSCGFPCGVRAVSATLIEVEKMLYLNQSCQDSIFSDCLLWFLSTVLLWPIILLPRSSVTVPSNCFQSSSHFVKPFRAPVCRMLGTCYTVWLHMSSHSGAL